MNPDFERPGFSALDRRSTLKPFLAILALASAPILAADYKVGFVTTDRIFREAAPAVRALKKIEKEFAPRDIELQKLAKRAKELQASLGKSTAMSETDRRNKEQE